MFTTRDPFAGVLTREGQRPIGELEVGDSVSAYDEDMDAVGEYRITAVHEHVDPVTLLLTIDGETLETTPNHPFYTIDGEWVEAGALRVGDQLRAADGSVGTVEAVAFVDAPQDIVRQQPSIEAHFGRQRRVYRMFTHSIAVALMQHDAERVEAQDQRWLLHYCLRQEAASPFSIGIHVQVPLTVIMGSCSQNDVVQ